MKKYKPVWIGGILLGLICTFGAAQTSKEITTNSFNESDVQFSTLAGKLRWQLSDFRYEFFSSRKAFDAAKQEGFFIITYGTPKDTKAISIKECSTVETALNKYAGGITHFGRQIRIVQQDTILQTPYPKERDSQAFEAILALHLHAGDVVLLTMVD